VELRGRLWVGVDRVMDADKGALGGLKSKRLERALLLVVNFVRNVVLLSWKAAKKFYIVIELIRTLERRLCM
jgi:hypothetical protein